MVENVVQIKSEITINVDAGAKNIIYMKKNEKDYIWNPDTCSCKKSTYLASITNDSVITCDEIIEETKTIQTHFNEKDSICKTKTFYLTCLFINYHCIIDSC